MYKCAIYFNQLSGKVVYFQHVYRDPLGTLVVLTASDEFQENTHPNKPYKCTQAHTQANKWVLLVQG